MITIPLFEASVAVGGRPNKAISPMDYILNITQQSSEVKLGTLFVALEGQKADGHDFIKEAEDKGAVAAVVEKLMPNISIPQILVPSTEIALGDLGRIWRCRLNIPVVAVTGSVGKTTTKELIAHVLQNTFKTHKSRKNYNNQLGVPIELSRLERDHECSVVEFGMRDLNQINYLSKIARPDFGVITNIGVSHIEILKTRENIAKAKAEIFEGMDTNGVTFLNIDDDFYEFISNMANCKVISYGKNEKADIRITDIELVDNMFPRFKLNGIEIHMEKCTGEYNAYNAAIAFGIANKMGVDTNTIAKQISSFVQPERRGVSVRLKNGALILDSTYNAAPDSIIANLKTISKRKDTKHRLVCIIGDMLELGSHSKEAHEQIGKEISALENKVDVLITVGDYTKHTNELSKVDEKHHFENSEKASEFMSDNTTAFDLILVQGSNGIKLDLIVTDLEQKFGIA